MHLLSLLPFLGLVTAATIPDEILDTRATSCPVAGSATLAAVKAAFTQAKIVPDVVPSFDPKSTLTVSYNGKKVNLGNTFAATGKHIIILLFCW